LILLPKIGHAPPPAHVLTIDVPTAGFPACLRGMSARYIRELLRNLVARDLKARYKGSALGVLWSLLAPLFMACVYLFFFRFLVGRSAQTESIIAGIFAWQFTAGCVHAGLTSVTANGNLVKKVAFPRWLLPLSSTLGGLVDYLLSLCVQLILIGTLLFLRGEFFTIKILLLPLVILAQLGVNFALALFLGGVNVVFRDTQHLVGVLLSAAFFLTPAMYDLDFLRANTAAHPWVAEAALLNPLAVILTALRACLIPGAPFAWNEFAAAGFAFTALFGIGSWFLFQRLQRDFADHV
jgi:ABC-type polysaccharide/polyol phosphate export permease